MHIFTLICFIQLGKKSEVLPLEGVFTSRGEVHVFESCSQEMVGWNRWIGASFAVMKQLVWSVTVS